MKHPPTKPLNNQCLFHCSFEFFCRFPQLHDVLCFNRLLKFRSISRWLHSTRRRFPDTWMNESRNERWRSTGGFEWQLFLRWRLLLETSWDHSFSFKHFFVFVEVPNKHDLICCTISESLQSDIRNMVSLMTHQQNVIQVSRWPWVEGWYLCDLVVLHNECIGETSQGSTPWSV